MRYHYLHRRVSVGELNVIVLVVTCDCCYGTLNDEDKEHHKSWYGKTRDKRIDLCKSCAEMLIDDGTARYI